MRLGSATCAELAGRVAVRLLVPLGATEQHGPHLPLETDTADRRRARRSGGRRRRRTCWSRRRCRTARAASTPAFPGTLSIGQEALELVLVELVRSAGGLPRRSSCCPGTAVTPSRSPRAVARAARGGAGGRLWQPSHVHGGDAHAGRVETSLMLALAPELVRAERPGRRDRAARCAPSAAAAARRPRRLRERRPRRCPRGKREQGSPAARGLRGGCQRAAGCHVERCAANVTSQVAESARRAARLTHPGGPRPGRGASPRRRRAAAGALADIARSRRRQRLEVAGRDRRRAGPARPRAPPDGCRDPRAASAPLAWRRTS